MSYWKDTGVKRLWGALLRGRTLSQAYARVMLVLDCSHTTAISLSKGDSPVDPDELVALCREADIDVGYVIGQVDEAGPFREPNTRKRAVVNGA